jgi:hypothetical protein
MAKQFEFKFSDSKEIIEPDKLTKGEIEKIILKNIFQLAGAQQKDIGNYLECKDCISQIDNLKDGAVLLLTENDLKYVKEGFEKTAGNRPLTWLEYGENIFRQVKNPIEHKE